MVRSSYGRGFSFLTFGGKEFIRLGFRSTYVLELGVLTVGG